jgi:octaprenyl-diphosphate synthase
MVSLMEYRDIQKPVQNLLQRTEAIMGRNIHNRDPLIRKLVESTPVAKGKKIRSTFLFLLAGLNRIRSSDLPRIAAAIEMFHLSSLVHDDVIDNSQWRRGNKTANSSFGSHLSVLWGDYLFINSMNMINELDRKVVTDTLVPVSRQMIEGQIFEYENSFNYRLKQTSYLNIIRKKTASLFEGIARIVWRMQAEANGDEEDFVGFGRNFGLMFQISDDLLDIFSGNSGKDHFRDLKEGKVTLPYILFLKCQPFEVLRDLPDGQEGRLLELFRQNRIDELSRKSIRRYHRNASRFLDGFGDSPYRTSFRNLLDFIGCRDY